MRFVKNSVACDQDAAVRHEPGRADELRGAAVIAVMEGWRVHRGGPRPAPSTLVPDRSADWCGVDRGSRFRSWWTHGLPPQSPTQAATGRFASFAAQALGGHLDLPAAALCRFPPFSLERGAQPRLPCTEVRHRPDAEACGTARTPTCRGGPSRPEPAASGLSIVESRFLILLILPPDQPPQMLQNHLGHLG